CKYGETQQIQDDVIKSNVFQLQSPNVNACCIACPVDPKDSLGIQLPFVTLLVKNLSRLFTFEITILDSEKIRRRVRVSSYHTSTKLSTFMIAMPICMTEGWNQLNLNLAAITSYSFKTTYMETVRVQVHANCRLRRIYFSDQLYRDDQLPNAYRMYVTKNVREKPKSTLKKKEVVIEKKPKAEKS
ncbi:cilia- and flagella-associated protein 20-like, partial [Aphis craccivora]